MKKLAYVLTLSTLFLLSASPSSAVICKDCWYYGNSAYCVGTDGVGFTYCAENYGHCDQNGNCTETCRLNNICVGQY